MTQSADGSHAVAGLNGRAPFAPHRTLLVGPSLEGGGAQRRFRYLAEHLFGGSADVVLLQGAREGLEAGGRAVIALGCRRASDYPSAIVALRRLIRRNRYEVVLSLGHYPNLLAWLATRRLGRPPALVLLEVSRPEAVAGIQCRPQDWLAGQLQCAAYRSARFVAANSLDGAEESERLFGLDARRVVQVPGLLDPIEIRDRAAASPEAPGHPDEAGDDRVTIIVNCRLERLKGVDTILRSFAELSISPRPRLVIVGDGPAKASLEKLALDLRLRDAVVFHGWQVNPLPFVARASVLVQASHFEGFSNSVLEALFLGTPVITSYCSSDARLMCEFGAALGFEVDDHHQLTRCLERVLLSTDQRAQLRARAAEYRRPFELPEAIAHYEDLVLRAATDGGTTTEPFHSVQME